MKFRHQVGLSNYKDTPSFQNFTQSLVKILEWWEYPYFRFAKESEYWNKFDKSTFRRNFSKMFLQVDSFTGSVSCGVVVHVDYKFKSMHNNNLLDGHVLCRPKLSIIEADKNFLKRGAVNVIVQAQLINILLILLSIKIFMLIYVW